MLSPQKLEPKGFPQDSRETYWSISGLPSLTSDKRSFLPARSPAHKGLQSPIFRFAAPACKIFPATWEQIHNGTAAHPMLSLTIQHHLLPKSAAPGCLGHRKRASGWKPALEHPYLLLHRAQLATYNSIRKFFMFFKPEHPRILVSCTSRLTIPRV